VSKIFLSLFTEEDGLSVSICSFSAGMFRAMLSAFTFVSLSLFFLMTISASVLLYYYGAIAVVTFVDCIGRGIVGYIAGLFPQVGLMLLETPSSHIAEPLLQYNLDLHTPSLLIGSLVVVTLLAFLYFFVSACTRFALRLSAIFCQPLWRMSE